MRNLIYQCFKKTPPRFTKWWNALGISTAKVELLWWNGIPALNTVAEE